MQAMRPFPARIAPAPEVFAPRDYFHMPRIDAYRVAAKVIDIQAWGDWFPEVFVGPAVSGNYMPMFNRECAIAHLRFCSAQP